MHVQPLEQLDNPGHVQLSARVNFQQRHASAAQTLMAGIIWAGSLALVLVFVWSATAMNVKLRPIGDCSPCSPGYHGLGPKRCPSLCVSSSLKDAIDRKCVNMPWEFSLSMHATSDATPLANGELVNIRRLKEARAHEALGDSPFLKHKSMMQLLASPYLLPVLLPLLLVSGTVWFALLQATPQCALWTTTGSLVAILAYGYYLTDNWMMLAIAGAAILFLAVRSTNLTQGCYCLRGGLAALSESRMSLLVIIVACLMMLMYTSLLVGLLVCTSQIMHLHVDKTKTCNLVPVSTEFSGPFLVLFLLTTNFFNLAASYSIAFGIGCWYFHQGDPQSPSTPMVAGLQMALFSRNGTGICAQAAALVTLVSYMESKVKETKCPCLDPLWCLMAGLYQCFHQCLKSLSTFAVVAVALEGGPLCATSQLAKDTLGTERSERFLVINSSLSWILKIQADALSTGFGLLALALIDTIENLGIFKAIWNGAGQAGDMDAKLAQWVIVAVVIASFWLMRRPLLTFTAVVLIHVYIGNGIKNTMFNSIMAAILVGCVGSLTFHQFAEAASASMSAMLYCWSLDEALSGMGERSGQPRCREEVSEFVQHAMALQPSAPPPEIQTSA